MCGDQPSPSDVQQACKELSSTLTLGNVGRRGKCVYVHVYTGVCVGVCMCMRACMCGGGCASMRVYMSKCVRA